MTVYVDNMRGDAQVQRHGRAVTGQWSHLLADDSGELAAFAADLSLRPEWLQAPGKPGEHYDIVEAIRRRAVAAGAVPISYPHDTDNVIATKRLQASALDAAGRGWRVFPLRPGTKVPAIRHWQHEATTDTEQITELWTAQLRRRAEWFVPEPRNIGIACGPSMLVVIDLDVEKPGRDRADWPKQWSEYDITSGAEALAAVADLAFQTVPATYTVATPSGGRHLYFDAPANAIIRNSVGHPGPMIDIRGVGGYVVAAGSRLHPSPVPDDQVGDRNRLAYRLIDDRPAADLPGWLTTTIAAQQDWDASPTAHRPGINDVQHRAPDGRSDGYGAAALRGEVDRIRSAPVGQRNHTLNSAAYSLGQLVAADVVAHDRVVEALTDAAASAGLKPAEIAATLSSGLTAGTRNPRTFQQAESTSGTADTAERSQPEPDVRGPGKPAPAPPDPARGTPDRPVFDQAAFDQAVAMAIDSAVRLVVEAPPDRRAASLREAAARVGRLMEVDGVDGPAGLDVLSGAAAQVGMSAAEIEADIAAGLARRWPIPSDNRPPPVTSGSVVAEMAARRKQAEFDAAKPHPEQAASDGKQPVPVPVEGAQEPTAEASQLPDGSPCGSVTEVSGAAHRSATDAQDPPADEARAVETLSQAAGAAGLHAAEIDKSDDQHKQVGETGRNSDRADALAGLDRAFEQAPAVAIQIATRLVTDAEPDERGALLRGAAVRIARLIDVDGIDGQAALDALTTAAGRVGMARTEVETAIKAGFAQSQDAADVDDPRSPAAVSGSVLAGAAAPSERLRLDAADAARERHNSAVTADDIDREDRSAQPVSPSPHQPDRAEYRPGHGAPDAAVAPVGADQPVRSEEGASPVTTTLVPTGAVDADASDAQKAGMPYKIWEIDAAYAGWLFAEAWHSWSTDREPCHPADTLRIACEGEGLPTLGSENRRYAPRRAWVNELPGEELVDRDVWHAWSQAQRDDWYFTREERAQAVAFRPRWHRENPEAPTPHEADAQDGSAAATPETARAEHRAAEPALNQPADADALVQALMGVLQTRGVIDRAAWDATVTAVAERSSAAIDRDKHDLTVVDGPGPETSIPEVSREEQGTREVAAARRSDVTSRADAAPVDAEVERVDAEPRPKVDRPAAGDHTDTPDVAPAPVQKPRPGGLGSPEAEVLPAEAPDNTPDPHTDLDHAIGQARAAISHAEANRAASSHSSRNGAAEVADHDDRPAYWAGSEVEL